MRYKIQSKVSNSAPKSVSILSEANAILLEIRLLNSFSHKEFLGHLWFAKALIRQMLKKCFTSQALNKGVSLFFSADVYIVAMW